MLLITNSMNAKNLIHFLFSLHVSIGVMFSFELWDFDGGRLPLMLHLVPSFSTPFGPSCSFLTSIGVHGRRSPPCLSFLSWLDLLMLLHLLNLLLHLLYLLHLLLHVHLKGSVLLFPIFLPFKFHLLEKASDINDGPLMCHGSHHLRWVWRSRTFSLSCILQNWTQIHAFLQNNSKIRDK